MLACCALVSVARLFLRARADAILCSARIDADTPYAADPGRGDERDPRLLPLSTACAGSILRAAEGRGELMPVRDRVYNRAMIRCNILADYLNRTKLA